MVQAGQGQLTIHEATLDGSVLEEPFLKEGRGSAFESRPSTLVVLRASERGLGLLRRKIEQLVGRGFHAIDVAFDGVGDKLKSPDEAWIGIRQGAQYAEQFAAWLVLSDAKPAVQAALEKAAARDGSVRVELFADARAAGEALRRRELEANDGVEPLQVGSTDALSQGSDDTVDPNDWGWGSQDTTETVQPGAELPAVDVAEVLLQADELATLRDRASQLVKRGKKYLTLRMHFKRDRRMSESDMAALVAARDQLASAGGQLVLASLQEEVLKWLKLLDEDRHFVVADSADAADLAHRRHAAGLMKAPAAADAAPFVVASSDARRIVVRPRGGKGGKGVTAALRVVDLGKDGLAHLAGRLDRIARDGVRDIAVDLARFKDVRGERFDAVPSAVDKARARGARVAFASASRDVKALLKLLGLDPTLAGETLDAAALALAAAHPPFEELRFDVTREDLLAAPPLDPVSSVDLEDELEVPSDQGSSAPGSAALSAEVDALKAQLAAARAESKRAAGELQDAKRAAEAATKATADAKRLEAELAAAKKQLDEHKKQADAARKLADEQKKYADGERTRVTELELLATQDGRDREELEQKLAAAGEAEARLAELEARLKDREARASSLEKALEALQDRAQELEAAAYKLPQLEKQLEARDAALAEQTRSQASLTSELQERDQLVSRLERDLRDAREVAGKQGQAAESAQSDRVRDLEDALAAAESKARAAEAKASQAEQKASAAEQKASAAAKSAEQKGASGGAAEQKAAQAEQKASAAESKASAAEQRASAAEAEARKAAERAATLEKELARARSAPPPMPAPLPAAPAPMPGSAGDLQRRVAELERKNAQILTEAEEEIARLTREQAQLREELESAGDMIERLGKELEFS